MPSKTLTWHPVVGGKTHDVTIRYFVNHTEGSQRTPVVIINGIGEGAYSAKKSMNALVSLGVSSAYSVELPFSQLPATEESIRLICTEVPLLVTQQVMIETEVSNVNLVARSQGGAAAIMAVHKNPALFRKVALIAPFGLTNNHLGTSVESRRKSIRLRLQKNILKNISLEYSVFRASLDIGSSLLTDLVKKRLYSSFNAALATDLRHEFLDVLQHDPHKIAIFASASDIVFARDEYIQSLPEHAIILQTKGPHAASVSKIGRAQLADAVQWLRQH